MAEARRISGKEMGVPNLPEQELKRRRKPGATAWPVLTLAMAISVGAVATHLATRRRKDSIGARIARGASFFETGAVWAYLLVIRPWHLRWGATDEEITKPLPGDEIIPNPKLQATHAITINASADTVWPWLVQMGHGRGGFYSYDWIENLMGLNIQSSDEIVDEFQHLEVGDTVPLAPSGFGPPVVAIEPGKYLVFGGTLEPKPGSYFSSSWGFSLEDLGGNMTRLIERFRLDWSPSLANDLFYRLALEPGSFIMERKMLLGIKERAESQYRE